MRAPVDVSVNSSKVVTWKAPEGTPPTGYLVQYAVGIGVGYSTLGAPVLGDITMASVPIDLSPNVMNFVRVGSFYGNGGVPVWSKPVGIALSVAEEDKGAGKVLRRGIKAMMKKIRGSA